MKFVVLVEGETETAVVGEFLGRWLNAKGTRIGVQTSRAHDPKGVVGKAAHYLAKNDPEIVAVIGLLDLHELKLEIPPHHSDNAKARFRWAKEYVEKQVNHPAFKMFFAVHELEAWLLSQPSVFKIQGVAKAVESRAGNAPENVNLGEPPSKFLNAVFNKHTGKDYKKKTQGRTFFDRLDPEEAYKKCPHLKEMLDKMLLLAQSALK
jgi:hypothetical protein